MKKMKLRSKNKDKIILRLVDSIEEISQYVFKDSDIEKGVFHEAEKRGIHFLRPHWYSTVPTTCDLKFDAFSDEERCVELLGIDNNKCISLINEMGNLFRNEVMDVSKEKKSDTEYWYSNGCINGHDAILYYYMLRYWKPKKVIEVGCGMSTLMGARAVRKNRDENIVTEMDCIEPYPSAYLVNNRIDGINELKVMKLQDVPIEYFKTLGNNDILFIDSTHVLKIESDVQYLFNRILPELNSGVIIHFHDIYLPYEFNEGWIRDGLWFWNEQYVLAAILMAAKEEYETVFPNRYIGEKYPEECKRSWPDPEECRWGGSYWIRKIK